MKKRILPDKICEKCGKEFNRHSFSSGRLEDITDYSTRRFCSRKCYAAFNIGSNHPNYKDGLKRGHDCGYLRLSDDTYLHRLVMAKHLGRKLKSCEHVHHIDGDVLNNDVSNLMLVSNSEHRKMHAAVCKRDSKGRFAK